MPRKPITSGPFPDTCLVPLTQGMFATIDASDAELVGRYSWWLMDGKTVQYAMAARRKHEKPRNILMHRLILDARTGQRIDHADRDGLNNRRDNLRFATGSENSANSVRPAKVSRYKGVSWHSPSKKWQAQLACQGRSVLHQLFHSEEDAARAYNLAAARHFGEFSRANDVSELGFTRGVSTVLGLSEREAEFVLLHREKGFAFSEIALKFGITLAAVRIIDGEIQVKVRTYQDGLAREEAEPDITKFDGTTVRRTKSRLLG